MTETESRNRSLEALKVGDIVIAKRDGMAKAGEVGVCWQADGALCYCVVFESGSFDTYSAQDVNACLTRTG